MEVPAPARSLARARTVCDLLVVGGGAAGLVAAQTARRLGARVVLVEDQALGGECLHTGCVPSKALLHAAEREKARTLRTTDPGSTRGLDAARRAVRAVAPHDDPARYRALGVDVRFGEARFGAPDTVEVGGDVLRARRLILATGSRPHHPEWPGLADVPWADTDTLWSREVLPHRLTVVGGGPSGCELAQAFVRLGHEVRLLEAREGLLPDEDAEAGQLLAEILSEEGVAVETGVRVERLERNGTEVRVVATAADGGPRTWTTDFLILALGRRPAPGPAGLDALGVARDAHGYLQVDPYLRTNRRALYACGDATGPPFSTAVAGRQGWCAAANALLGPWLRFRWAKGTQSRVVYTDPEVALVGAPTPVGPFRSLKIDLGEVDRALVEERTRGFLRLNLDRRGRICGAVLACPHAGELAAELVRTIDDGGGAKPLLTTFRAYPTYGEILTRGASRLFDERWDGSLLARVAQSLVALGRLPLPGLPALRPRDPP